MEEQARQSELRLAALEKATQADRQTLQGELERAQQQLDRLQKLLDQATRVVTRNSADVGAQVQQNVERIDRLEGRIEEIQQSLGTISKESEARVAAVARQAGVDAPIDDKTVPTDRTAHFAAAKQAAAQDDFGTARGLYLEYLKRYPQDAHAGEAQYMVGVSYLEQDRPAKALGEFRKVPAKYANSEVVDDTLLSMAEAFYRLQACSDAKAALQTLLRNHPRSTLVPKAKNKMREVERAPRGYCTS